MRRMHADRERIVEDLSVLVSVPSVTGSERRIQEVVAGLLDEMTLDVDWIETDPASLAQDPAFPGIEVPRDDLIVVAGRYGTGRPGPRRMLLGHVDVVPPGDASTWTTPAFEPTVVDGRLYGRGACDMKGGVVAMLEAVRLAFERDQDLTGTVLVVAVPSEEDGGAGTLSAIRAGYVADMAVIPEPTNLDVVVAHAGAITFTLRVPGRAAHASTRREGVSALDKLFVLVEALREDERIRNETETNPLMTALGLPYPTIIGQVEGGNWASTVMDSVEADGRYGVRLGQNCDGAGAELLEAITRAWNTDEWLSRFPVGVETWGGRFDSAVLPVDHPLPRSITSCHEAVTGVGAEMVGVPYGADMRLLINQGNTPTVMYGPGDVRVAHAADEFVPIDQVATCAEVLARWLTS
ncbi:MAG: ArgE/DapE family deacylase [Acidimicrobiia bacterium]|nr:ArgE/DapE family deacylase [Acidimicrobiia bacterium]